MKCLVALMMCCASALAEPTDQLQMQVGGQLVTPPCQARFAASLEVALGKTNINQLANDEVPVSEVPLVFDCRPGSRVSLILTAGVGKFDDVTLLTDRAGLGLRIIGEAEKSKWLLGQARTWTVGDSPLQVSLKVKPVSLLALPQAGNFSATLLMQILYL